MRAECLIPTSTDADGSTPDEEKTSGKVRQAKSMFGKHDKTREVAVPSY